MSKINFFKLLFFIVCTLGSSACSRPTNGVDITPVSPRPNQSADVFNIDLVGTITAETISTSHRMPNNLLGRMSIRTRSASPGYVMTSGIGVD